MSFTDGLARFFGLGQAPALAVVPPAPVVAATARPSVSELIWVEPTTRIWLDWSPDTIRAAEVLAAAGSYRLAAHLCRSMQSDDRVLSSLGQLCDSVLGEELSFEASGDRRRSRKAIRAIEADEDFWEMCPESELREFAEWYGTLGIALAQLVPVEVNGRLIPRMQVWDPRFLRFDILTRRWLVTIDGGVEIPIAPGDGRWMLATAGSPLHVWQRAPWRAIARWWLLKDYARSDWGRYSEVKAGGILVANAVDEKRPNEPLQSWTASERKKLTEALNTLGRDTSIALPRGIDLKIVEAAANTYETFTAQIDYANAGIAIAYLGQNLTTEVKGGSLAASRTHEAVATGVKRALASALASVLHDQQFVYWAAWNFGDAGLAPWARWDVEPASDMQATGAGLKALGDGLQSMRTAGVDVDAVQLCEEHGVPVFGLIPKPEPMEPGAAQQAQQAQQSARTDDAAAETP